MKTYRRDPSSTQNGKQRVRAGSCTQNLVVRTLTTVAMIMTAMFTLSLQANAQDADGGRVLEEIVVTGSHIRTSEFEARSPIQVLNADDIADLGVTQPQDILKALTINSGSELYQEESDRVGVSQFSLRGLGVASTLTLVNGRRAGVAALVDPAGQDFVDLNQFPLAMIERIDILADGASATYGSDAVAGVANIITRKGFDGLEISGDYRDASNESYSLNLVAGKRFDGGLFNVYATWYDQTLNDRRDFEFNRVRILGNGDTHNSQMLSSTGSPGSYLGTFVNASGQPETLPNAVRFTDPDCEAAGGFLVGGRCRHSFAGQYGPIADERRAQVFAEFEMDLTENVTYFGEVSYSRNLILARFGSPFFSNGGVANTGTIAVPGDHPFNFFITDPNDPDALVYIGPETWDNSIHTGADLACECRPFGDESNNGDPRRDLGDDRQERIYTRMVHGLELDAGGWFTTASYQFAHSAFTREWPVGIRADAFQQAVTDGRFNPFGTKLANPNLISPKDGVSTAENGLLVQQDIIGISATQYTTEQHVVDLITSKELMEVAGGPLGVAFGAQYRYLERKFTPDSLDAASEGFIRQRLQESIDDQKVTAVFAELIYPVTDWADLQFALRHETFGDGGETTDPKIAARITVNDWLGLRGSYGTSFQQPTLQQTSRSVTLQRYDDSAVPGVGPNNAQCDPANGQTTETFTQRVGFGLDPQSAENYNFGVIFAPTDNMNLSVDFWNYDYTDLIAPSESGQAILDNDCSDDGIPNDPRIVRDGSGQLISLTTEFTNIGSVEASGLDLVYDYQLPTGTLGDFLFDVKATYVSSFDVTDPAAGTFDAAGNRNALNNFGPQPQWRANFGLNWAKGNHTAGITTRYIDSYTNDEGGGGPIDSWTTIDLQYGITLDTFGGETRLTIGANNLFDEDPPALNNLNPDGTPNTADPFGRPGYDPRVHDIRGRILYVSAKYVF